jgi:hypothetical protein
MKYIEEGNTILYLKGYKPNKTDILLKGTSSCIHGHIYTFLETVNSNEKGEVTVLAHLEIKDFLKTLKARITPVKTIKRGNK